jgi:6-phosphogluconate dehydrogenase (decarboxylating)
MQIGLVGLGRMGADIMPRDEADFADRVLSAVRFGFAGHEGQKG